MENYEDFTAFLGILCDAYTELLKCKQAQFEAVVISDKFLFHLDTFLRCAWRPSEALPFARGTQASNRFMQLRVQVLDTLSRACKAPSSGPGKRPVIHILISSAVAALDVCALYANDQVVTCQRIMNIVVQHTSILSEIGGVVQQVEDHLAQLHAWVRQLATVTMKQMGDVLSSLEDTIATLLSLFLAMPSSIPCVMSGSDHAFTTPLAILHDEFLGSTLLEKIGTRTNAVQLRDRVTALSVACEKLACLLLADLLDPAPPSMGPSTSKALEAKSVHNGEDLLAALVEMQVPEIEHRKSLLASLSEYRFMDTVDDKLRKSEMELDGDQYSYVLSLLNLPDRAVPVAGSNNEAVAATDSKVHDVKKRDMKVHAPQYNRTRKRELIQEVKDCLPDEDENLIEACLASMDWNAERCVDAILQNKFELGTKGRGHEHISGSDLVYAPGKVNSFTASKGHIKDMKQKTFQLLQMAEDAEQEYEDEYDDGFDALNFVKGSKDVRTEADSTETDTQTSQAEQHPAAEHSTAVQLEAGEGSRVDIGGQSTRRVGRGGRREAHRGRRGVGGHTGRHTGGRGSVGGRNFHDRSSKGRGPVIV